MSYPATIELQRPERLANWRPLVQWILAIPHLIISYALTIASNAIAIVSWFAIVFTGRLPAGLANFQVMTLRYRTRVTLYAGYLYEAYPPFEFNNATMEPGGSPVTINILPALENRNRLTVGLRLLWLIPAALYSVLIGIAGAVCWFIGFFAVLFTGRWPEGLWSWVMKSQRVSIRLNAYALMLTDEYPPFVTD